jgi:hypothetical protein
MPWKAYASMTKADANAIAAYLKSLPLVKNKVAGPSPERNPDRTADEGGAAVSSPCCRLDFYSV